MSGDDRTRLLPEMARVGVGTQLSGIYELDKHLASGGMGEVYKGHNIQTGDLVAIKIVLPEYARDPTILSLFRKEASVLNHLSHDAVVRYHVFTIDPALGRPYLAMEFVDGEPLFDVIRRGPMQVGEVRRLCLRLAAGLGAVHEAHTFHRDLSPDNIILPDGRVDRAKIIDFGIARSAKVGDGTLIGGRFAGKYNYVSPEQLGLYGGEVAAQSDIYSLGLVLAAALRGAPLDMGGSQWEVVEKRRRLPDLSDLDEDFRPVIEAMLQPDPRDRPVDMGEVIELVREGMTPDGDAATPPTRPPRRYAPAGLRPEESDSAGRHVAATPRAEPPPAFVPYQRPAVLDRAKTGARSFADGPSEKSGGMARWIAAAIVLIAVLGGAGAYFGDLFDPAAPAVTADARPRPSVTPPVVAAPPKVEVVAPPTPNQQIRLSPPAPPPPPAPQPVAVEPAPAPAQNSAAAPVETARAPTPPATTAGQNPAQPVAPGGEVAIALPRPQPPPVQPLDGVAARIAWLRDFPGGDCFYAAATAASDSAIEIEGFGATVEPFERMLEAFKAKFGLEPELYVRQIDRQQCAVTDFLRAIDGNAVDAPRIQLANDLIASGSVLSGSLTLPAGLQTSLLLVDHRGLVTSLDSNVRPQAQRGVFNIPIRMTAADEAAGLSKPQIILAITAAEGLATTAVTQKPASSALPAIVAELQARRLTGAVTAKLFKLGG